MTEPTKNQGYFDPRTLFADPERAGSRGAQVDEFDPKVHYQQAWQILKRAPFVFALKLAASLASGLLWVGVALLVALPILVVVGRALSQNLAGALPGTAGVMGAAAELMGYIGQPAFVLGVFGLLAGAWGLSLSLHALASAGVWGTLCRGTHNGAAFLSRDHNSLSGIRAILRDSVAYFPRVLGLQVMVACIQAIMVLLSVLLLSGVLLATGRGVFADSPALIRAFLWAWPLTLLSALMILVRLSTEVAAVPVIRDGMPVGQALYEGANFVVGAFVPVYRVLLYAAKLFLLPLLFYWMITLSQSVVLALPQLAPLFDLLRVVAFAVLFVASSVIAVFFKAALFSYYEAVQTGARSATHHRATSRRGARQSRHHSQHFSKGPMHKPTRSARIKMTRETTLDAFLPDEYPNIVDLSALIRAPQEPHEDEAPEPSGLKTRPGLPGFGDFAEASPSEDAVSTDDIFAADDDPTP